MGDYGIKTFVEASGARLPVGFKGSSSFFPLLTDGVLVDDEQAGGVSVHDGMDQACVALELGAEVAGAGLADLCGRHGLSTLSVLNVAWALVLAAYADTEQVTVLSVHRVAGEARVGFYETELDGGRTVLQALEEAEQRLRASSMEVPAATTVAELQTWTGRDGHPVFNSVVLLSDGDVRAETGDYIAIQARKKDDGPIAISLQAPSHLLPAGQVKHCAATLSHVLGEIVQHPDLPVAEVSMMSPQGLQQIARWNAEAPAVVSRCLHHLVDETAQARPDALAIDGQDGRMTYAELQAYTDALAHRLAQLGVGPEVAVPLFFEKSQWAIVAMIGVVKAGGAIVNLDAKQPKPRLQGLLDQLQPPLVLTSTQLSGLWGADEVPTVVVSRDTLAHLPVPDAAVASPVTPRNTLYIIFTSGSTGTPKGCVVEHESFLTAAAQHVQAGNIIPSSRVLQMTPYTFDVSMLEIFTTLTTGACICFPGDDEAARGIAHIINHLQISWTFMTPSLVRLIDPATVPTLKTLALGGEALGRIDVKTWADKLHLINGYGPSECSVAATVNQRLTLSSDPANIGVGYGALCWVVHPDDHHRLVPIGAVGELVIQGPIVARGYLNEPGKTAAVFLDEVPEFARLLPAPPPAFRLYKTGDLVRQNSDGTINFLGRKDRQVKLNGQRIELGEIEQRLSVDEQVRHAMVLLPKQGPCKGRLVAALSLHAFPYAGERDAHVHLLADGDSGRAREGLPGIAARLATQLPAYMMPTFWVVLAALPFTTSGKVHGTAMAQWLHEMSEETYSQIADGEDSAQQPAALSSEVEFQMQQIWADELGIPVAELRVHRSFIALGGDSIAAMKVVARCRQLQLAVSVPDILRAQNLIDLAARAVRVSSGGQSPSSAADRATPAERIAASLDQSLLEAAGLASRDQVEDVYGCSPMQDGILLSQIKFPGTYEISQILRVQSTRDAATTVARLQTAWQAVMDRHQVLRTIFAVDLTGQFRQVVLKQAVALIQTCECLDDEQAVVHFLKQLPAPKYQPSQPQHRLTVCRAAGDAVYIKVEISHALVDGGSTEVILHELSAAFDGAEGLAAPAAARFSDYIEHVSAAEAGGDSMRHWTSYLAGVQPSIVPMYPPAEGNVAREIRSVAVPFTQIPALTQFCEDHGVTVANVLQTAWALVLRAYTGADDVCFGYVAAGRDVPVAGIEHAVGAFINMLVCRVRLDQQQAVLGAVEAMQNEYFDALPYQHTSLAQIQHGLNLSGMPLFNSIISVQKDVSDQPYGESLSFRPLTEDDPTDFDLAVAIHVLRDHVKISIGYWSSLLSDGDAANLANTFSGAISGILASAQSPAASIDLFTEQDRARIFAWNKEEPAEAPGVVHDYFYAQVDRQPNAPAVCAWDGGYTYAELDYLSEKLAHHLARLGAGPEVLIPHCFDKSKLATVVMVAIMKSGSAGVGLSSAHPASRLQDIIENCAAHIAVVATKNAALLSGMPGMEHIVVVDEAFLDGLPAPDRSVALPQAQPCNPAFVSFTSGSTGKPKGIVLEHRSLITSILAHGTEWGIDQSARVLQFSAYAFDASVSDTFTTLVGGGTICIPDEKDRVDDLAGAINRLGVNWAFLTPRVLGLLSPALVPTLKTVVLGGEAISREDIAPWTEAISLRIVYGPTECTIYSMGTDPLTRDSDPASLGHAVGTRLWVTDPDNSDKLMPVGCVGELLIEGPLVTRGYLNAPDKTKAAYLEDGTAWLPGPPRRFYKTSDLVRYYPDGQLRFIGRKDTQIKVRGQRVELGEIEHAILENLPGAVHITVDSVVFPPQTLVAFLYMGGDEQQQSELFTPLTSETTAQLRALEKTLSKLLPVYMVPSLFVPISHIPMTISGKVDRIALRRAAVALSPEQKEMYALQGGQERAAPQTPNEERLRNLWAAVLGKEPGSVGRSDSFFRLGGDSIGAMKLVAAARAAGFVLSVANIFRYPELSDMAEHVEVAASEQQEYTPFSLLEAEQTEAVFLEDAARQCAIPREVIQDVYPATPLQEGVFLMSTTHQGAYVAPTAFRLPAGAVDVARFQETWQALVDAHAILRTRLVTVDSAVYQVVLSKEASQIEWERADCLDAYLQGIQALPVTAGAPLTRYAVIPDGEDTIFVWTAHHAVFDGWMVRMLFQQLQERYAGAEAQIEAQGLAQGLPSVAYAQFVQFLQQTDADASSAFWASVVPADELPAAFPRLPSATHQPTANQTCRRSIATTAVDPGSNLTMSILLRAAWAIVLARYTDAEDIVYGLTLSGRDVAVAGIEDIVGPTITTVPMNVHLEAETLVETFLQSQQERNVEMMNHQHAGLQAIRRISPAASAATEFTNLFVVQPAETADEEAQSGALSQLERLPTDMSRFDPYALMVECTLGVDGGVQVEARFDEAVLSMDQTERLLGHFEHVLKQLSRPAAGLRLCDLDMFSPEDARQVWEWNAVPATTENVCVHDQIAGQAQRQPDHVAIDAWDGSVTYRELDELSSRLAHWLATTHPSIHPESLVPLCFDKSLWTIVTMLAVVKAGGGVVMLNPEHPIARLESLIADTTSPVVLASPERAGLFASTATTVVIITEELVRSLPAEPSLAQSLPPVLPTNPVFVIFTSGSTGKPKGIIVQHNCVSTVAIQHGEGLGFTSTPGALRVLQFASFSFDVSMGEVFLTLTKGGTLCIPNEYDRINNLAATINRMNITWTFMAPTVAALLEPREVPNLQTLVLGGEAVSQSLVDQWASHVHLVDSYGPAECTIWASHAIPGASVSPSNIGRGAGCRYWVVDMHDHNRLAPVGCVGELLIEGPNVSRGYLNEPEKTAAAFIESPGFMQDSNDGPRYKFYRTGDLVRYNADGSLNIAGRKDGQVKFHGQRIELGEIEFHLRDRAAIEAGMVTLAKTGLCKGKLVAAVALSALNPEALEGERVELIDDRPEVKLRAQTLLAQVQEEMRDKLPAYMVPTIWIVLSSIPLTASRKINRVPISRWVANMSEETYRRVVDIATASSAHNAPATALEKTLAQVWSHVLNMPEQSIGLNRSFLSLGGDSITAMQVVSRCRALDIQLGVQDILQPKSLAGVVARAQAQAQSVVAREEVYDVSFALSPIQQIYFEDVVRMPQQHHYNQSVLLRLARPVSSAALSAAIQHIVASHAMLRARFTQNADGEWTQLVRGPGRVSTEVAFHTVSREEMLDIVNAAQRSLDIEHGRVFAVDHFTVQDSQLVSLIAHHLVIDAVSWHIIVGQLEQLLSNPNPNPQRQSRMSFQSWVQEQRQYAERLEASTAQALPAANMEYWGLEQLPTWEDGEEVRFTLDTKTTSQLLTTANNPLRSEPVDLLLAAIQQSFSECFPDRAMPAIFSEGHGREPWEASIELSDTVGWFTTFYPVVNRHVRKNESVKETIKRTKDARRAFDDNGFSDFTRRHFARAEGSRNAAMEICFNYLGQAQHTERADALLQEEALQEGEEMANIGDAMGRLAVFDISAAVSHGRLAVSFLFNRNIRHREQVRRWAQRCEAVIHSAVVELVAASTTGAVEHSLSDFPLMQIDYTDISKLTNTVLPGIGLTSEAIEDLYPCSPIQEGILISQDREPGTYEVRQLFEVVSRPDQAAVDVQRLLQAWQRTVDRHALLRTVFIKSLTGTGAYDQLLLHSHQPHVQRLVYEGAPEDIAAFVASRPGPDYRQPVPAHRLTICEAKDTRKVYCQLEVSHALIDGTSLALVVRDLVAAYENSLPATAGPPYSNYISYLSSRSASEGESMAYWTTALAGMQPCHFPGLQPELPAAAVATKLQSVYIDTDGQLQRFCEAQNITMSNLFLAAWGLVLRAYTASQDVCFGYMVSGRDIPVDNIYEAVGPFINLVVCRVDVRDEVVVRDLLEKTQADYLNCLPHQHTSLASIQHELGNNEVALFNTILSLQREPSKGPAPEVEFKIVDQVDPTEYDVDLSITTGDAPGVEIEMAYRTAMLNDSQADSLMKTFTSILLALTTSWEQPLAQLDVSPPAANEQLREAISKQPVPAAVELSVSELIEQRAQQQPTAVAVQSVDGQVSLTYSELDRSAKALAAHLHGLGVTAGDLVPLGFTRSPWALVAMLAVLRVGAVYVHVESSIAATLPPTLNPRVMLCDNASDISAMTEVIVDAEMIEQLPIPSSELVYPSSTATAVAVPDGDDWALLAHRSISTVASQLAPIAGLGCNARVLQFSNPATSPFHLVETLYSLVNGATVVIPTASASFVDAVHDSRATWAVIPPSLAALVSPASVPSLQTLVVAGEELGPSVLAQWRDITLVHPYGLIDSSVWQSVSSAPAGIETLQRRLPQDSPAPSRTWISSPFSAASLALADCVGAVLVDGPIVPQGYLSGRRERFIERTAWLPDSCLYRTGDYGRWGAETQGPSYIVRPTQIVNNQSVDLATMEEHIQSLLPTTQHAVLVVVPQESSECIAMFQIDRSQELSQSPALLSMSDALQQRFTAIKESLRSEGAESVLPALFFPVNGLPLTADYKLDRAALQSLVASVSDSEMKPYRLIAAGTTKTTNTGGSDLTASEKLLANLWMEALEVAPGTSLSATDSFFRLGGDSIVAMRLVAAARNQGLALTIKTVFQQPVLSDMAKELRLLSAEEERQLDPFSLLPPELDLDQLVAEAAQQCGIEPTTIEDMYPCTPLQEGLMALTMGSTQANQGLAYVMQETFSLPDSIDVPRFKAAWEAVIARSSILRTRIITTSEGAFQVLLQAPPPNTVPWVSGDSLDAFLAQDAMRSMTYGHPLARYAVVGQPGQQQYFIWTAHHAVYDGLTLPGLAQQVSAEYRKEIALPEVPYNRFINHIQRISPAMATEFWLGQCAVPATNFPVLPPNTSQQPAPDRIQKRSLPLTRVPSDVTLSTVLRAAWAVVLSDLSESDNVNFGLTLSGRNAALAGINQVLGPTIATVPLRVQVRGHKSPADFLRAVHQQAIDMIPFEHTGLQNIRRMGGEEQGRQAVEFQNLLIIQPGSSPNSDGEADDSFLGLTPVLVGTPPAADPYPLSMECSLFDNRVEIKAQFDSRFIADDEMARILKSYARAIERLNAVQITAARDTAEDVDKTPENMDETISAEDLQQILAWNADRPAFVDSCVHEQFEEQVRLRPDALAISSFDVELTYRELNELANRLAMVLIERGVQPEMHIPLVFHKCSWTIVALLAVMKAGGASCMFNPEHPKDRIQMLMDDLQAQLVLCDQKSTAKLSTLSLPAGAILPVDAAYLDSLPTPETPPTHRVKPSDAVLVVYTSGSTGKPKGSILEHRSLVTGLLAHSAAMGMGPETRTFQFSAYTFDVCFEEIIGSLMLGACVCVPSDTERMNSLGEAMAKYRVTWSELTTTVASLLVPSSIPTLEVLALGGESLSKEVIKMWAGSVKRIINTYGPSECCVSSTCNLDTATLGDPTNIGRGLGCNTWIADPDNIDRLVPIGAPGELLIEGPIVGREYLNEPVKSAAAFIQPPAWWPSHLPPSRIYRTGDLAKYNPDGTIKFLGRKDTQVKLHGQRIEMGEIEHRIRSAFPDASHQAAVDVLTPKSRGGLKILTAFICESDAVSEDTDNFLLPLHEGDRQERFLDLYAHVVASLPRHMVPQLFIPVSHMPVNPSRKLERKALRTVGNGLSPEVLGTYALTAVAKTSSPPTTATEIALAEIWAKVLGTTSATVIGVDDNFFHLGGDSVAAMKAVAAANKIGLPLSFADIGESPTLAKMSEAADRASEMEAMDDSVPAPFALVPPEQVSELQDQATAQCAIPFEAIEDIYPCTPSQEALMALTARDETAYVSRAVYRLPIDIDLDRYRQAWDLLAERQAIMRTRIILHDTPDSLTTQSFQVVVNEPLQWQTDDSVAAYLATDKLAPMVHGQALMRFGILPAGSCPEDPRPVFIHTAHHAVYDGWSESSMFAEAKAIYLHGLDSLAPAAPYSRFIRYMVDSTVEPGASDAFWRGQLDGDLPAQFPPPGLSSASQPPRPNRTQARKFSLGPQASAVPYSTPTILKAAWALLLGRYTTSEDVIFGHVLSGRTVPLRSVSDMMGPTIATVPVRVRLTSDETIADFLRRVQEQGQAMAPFEQVGLQNIRRLLPAASSDMVDFGHLFVIQPTLDEERDSDDGLALELVDNADNYEFETYPLLVECELGGTAEVTVDVRYNDAIIAPDQMSWLLQHFENIVHQLCQLPLATTRMGDLTLSGPEDVSQLLQWMGPPVAPVYSTLHKLFQAQVCRHPERVALAAWDGDLTYAELDGLSSQFARVLINLDLQPGTAVGVMFDKSRWAVVSLLALLKAGGACVQLDPKHPPARLTEIVADSGLHHVLAMRPYAELAAMLPRVEHVVVVDATSAAQLPTAAATTPAPIIAVDPTMPAYLTFTSGSTGKPKVVVISHRAICTSIASFSPALHLQADSRVLQFAAYTFDISYGEIFAPLLLGATVCILSEHDRLNDLAGAIRRLGATWACLTPTVAGLIQPAEVCPQLQTLVLSGECPTEANLQTWAGQVPALINAYGPSEASVWCSVGTFQRPDDRFTNIGVPVGCRLWIADADNLNRLTPLGCVGELLIEGPILFQGYLNNRNATTASLLSGLAWMEQIQPLEDFQHVYRTGDLARYLPGGQIEYLGRADTQIKIYGRRIEVREIEHHIRTQLAEDEYTMVDSVAVNSQKLLVMYLYHESGPISAAIEPADLVVPLTPELEQSLLSLQASLRSRLPHYMVPSLFVPLRRMPTSAAGKTERRTLARVVNALSDAQRQTYALAGASIAKRPLVSALEHQLARLWAGVLAVDVDSIGGDDNFFGLGGDSIIAMKVVSLARAAQLALHVADLFNHPVLADLARHVSAQVLPPTPGSATPPEKEKTTAGMLDLALAAAVAPQVGVGAGAIEAVVPTTDFQDLALVGHLTSSRWMLNWFYFDGPGAPDVANLRRGCHALVQHFDILRTVFAQHAGRFWQVVLRELEPNFRVETTSDVDAFTKTLYADGVAGDLHLSEPYVRFVLAVHPDGVSHRLLMRLSHAQYDGVSLPTLWETLQRACQGLPLPITPSFSHFLEASTPADPNAALAHWRQLLAGAPETRFVSYSKPALRDPANDAVLHVRRTRIPVHPLPKHGITAATVVKAAWAVLLARLAAHHDVTFGNTTANRNAASLPGVDAVVGPCLNVVPVRAQLQPGQTVLQLLLALQQQQVANMPYEAVGFRQIITECTTWPRWTHFSSVVQHQNIEPDRSIALSNGSSNGSGGDPPALYEPGFLGAELDLTDVSLLSTPAGEHYVDLDLVTSTAVMPALASELLIDQLSLLLGSWAVLPLDQTVAYEANPLSPALLPLVHAAVVQPETGTRPAGAVCAAVQDAWRAVLPSSITAAAAQDDDDDEGDVDFFRAGGDLVQMAQLLAEMRQNHGLPRAVHLETLAQHSSLHSMGGFLSNHEVHWNSV
ncbi:hypothetical protein ASPZODRAFT_137284 [Penicilliopsis zonata CBS 506.65]|uniref:Carrier domain-containing protein n=1 Tax=Penicilliopsis zonata CBS 506.65 TaxID=1073090 RepID=A0A1L9S5P2_9EURO|nr:hypothetical protein ASPZODRAFT_137284 [Penicilliopsis zonata CBS 506.65]OJJ42483.1 hypothetical protein ASPZODRAFT_137284 [Penicilliopsis zonata CBS 506.65]